MIDQPTPDKPRYLAVQIDKRTGAHQIFNNASLSNAECISIFQSIGSNSCESPYQRVMFIAHVGIGESWWSNDPASFA
jgi:hypothetical protein